MTRQTNLYYNNGYTQGRYDVIKEIESAIDEIKEKANTKKAIPEFCGMMEAVEILRKYI